MFPDILSKSKPGSPGIEAGLKPDPIWSSSRAGDFESLVPGAKIDQKSRKQNFLVWDKKSILRKICPGTERGTGTLNPFPQLYL